MSLLIFPNELILNVAENLSLKALNSLIQTSHRLAYLLTPLLHKNAVKPIDECPALCWAASRGHEPLVKLLLEKGLPIEARDKESSKNALIFAAQAGHEEIVRTLLDKGAGISSQELYDGLTALHWAARLGHESIVRLLLERGAGVNCQDGLNTYRPYSRRRLVSSLSKRYVMGRNNTALHWAAYAGHDSVVKVLLENGASVNVRNTLQDTPLIIATAMASESMIKLLIDGGADLNTQNLRGWTALHWAARNELKTPVRLLLEGGANPLLQDNGGLSPSRYSRVRAEKPIHSFLRESQPGRTQQVAL